MCLAIPGKVVKKSDCDMGTVDFGGVEKEISLVFLPEVEIGDWVIIHIGFALQIISAIDAQETLSILSEMYQPGNSDQGSEDE